MLPFRVQCVTCNARLKVNDPAVVGEVHSCPKCGSMVQLIPPPGWNEAEAATEPAAPQPAPTASPTPDFAAVGDLGVSLTESSLHEAHPASDSSAAEAPFEQPTEAVEAAVAPAEATAKWVSLAIAGGGVTLFLATGLVFWLTSGGDKPSVAGDEPPVAEAHVVDAAPVETPTIELQEPAEQEPAEPGPVEPGPVEPIEAQPAEPPPPVEVVAARPELPPEPAPVVEPALEAPAETEPEPAPAIEPFDPLDFDPASLDLILTKGPVAAPEEPPASPVVDDPTAGLDARLASNAGLAENGPAAGLDARLQGIAEDARAVVRRGPTAPPAAAAGRPLEVVIPEIQLADMPLERVCRLLGDIAGAPVTLDADALRYAGVRAGRPVTLRGSGESVDALFDKLLGPVRLEIADEGHGLVVSRIGARQPRNSAYDINDLGDADELKTLIEKLLPRVRATLAVEAGRLVVDGDAAAHMEVAILCERLRKARGLKPQSRYPRELLRTTPALAELDEVLSRRATFNFIDFTRLPEVFDHWRRTTGLVILVDGAALSDLDLTPATTIACTVNDRPWREALDAVLGELGLAWRAIDGGTIEITTAAAAMAKETIEFYPLRAGVEVEELRAAAAGGEAIEDDASRALIVRASAAGQRAVFAASRE